MALFNFKTLITVLILMFSSILNISALDNQIIIETWYEIEQYSNWEYEEIPDIDFPEPEVTKTHEMLDEARERAWEVAWPAWPATQKSPTAPSPHQ